MKRIIELDIEDLAYNGQAIGYDNGKVTFVKGGLPGERVRAKITKIKKKHNQAKVLEVLIKSPERIDAVCGHYEVCGGCIWQDLGYERQLFYKRNQIESCLKHIGGFDEVVIDDIHPSPEKFFYRNKMEFSFHTCAPQYSTRGFLLGLHERGRFDKIFDISDCRLQSEMSNRLVIFLREEIERLSIPVYNLIEHHGFLRFVIFREGKNTGQSLLVLVSGAGDFVGKEELVASLQKEFPILTTAVWTVNDTITNIAKGEIREVLFGPGYIEEEVMDLRFRISPGSFFQTNSRQAENLYRRAIELAGLSKNDTLLDLYCGAGAIGICAAGAAGSVVGIDIEEEAIEAAIINAQINNLDNIRFFAGPARKVLSADPLKDMKFDVVINDPPRAGMHPKALKRLIEIDAERLVYISCNPATFARDAAELRLAGYSLGRVTPFDMFPHTMHIELVAHFEKKG
ncbi:MAG: 23S rRNA (uracil(1939)-C(5))-methyltransferase RlmD [FCB group bacterium]|nr:23S rRNA (uracil(1939)-C(5))-methyltransferase RlmD [FCB group bacterium]